MSSCRDLALLSRLWVHAVLCVCVLSCRLVHPNKAQNMLEADYHQKILMRFQLKDRLSGEFMTAHQVSLHAMLYSAWLESCSAEIQQRGILLMRPAILQDILQIRPAVVMRLQIQNNFVIHNKCINENLPFGSLKSPPPHLKKTCCNDFCARWQLYWVCVQTFVRLTNLKSKQEIIFVSEADNTLTNKFDLVSLPTLVYNTLSTALVRHWAGKI